MDDVRQPQPAQASQAADTPPARGRARAFIALFLVLAILGGGGFYSWFSSRNIVATDDAFVDAHVSQVAAQIGGRIIAVRVQDNQLVAAGDGLARIDPRDAQIRLDQALAQQAQAVSQRDQAYANVVMRQAALAQAGANVTVADAELTQARQDLARYRAINPRAITRQALDLATSTLQSAQARREASRQAVAGMRAQVDSEIASAKAAAAAVQIAQTNVANARLQLSYTSVTAPAPGRVTRRTAELGNMVTAGQPLLAIVQPGLWVTANFKETQLGRLRPGQPVDVQIDAFPDAKLGGHVDSVQAGTGSVFATLPSENATGNYVKVIQRVPVKILFDGDPAAKWPLAPGMSVYPRVDVR